MESWFVCVLFFQYIENSQITRIEAITGFIFFLSLIIFVKMGSEVVKMGTGQKRVDITAYY